MTTAITNYHGQIRSVFILIPVLRYLPGTLVPNWEFNKGFLRSYIDNLISEFSTESIEVWLAIGYVRERVPKDPSLLQESLEENMGKWKGYLKETVESFREPALPSTAILGGSQVMAKPQKQIIFKGISHISLIQGKLSEKIIKQNVEIGNIGIVSVLLSPDGSYTVAKWTQDLFWTMEGHPSGVPELLFSAYLQTDKGLWLSLQAFLEDKATDFPVRTTSLPLDGGNILVGENFMIVGLEHIERHSAMEGRNFESIQNQYLTDFNLDQMKGQIFVPGINKHPAHMLKEWPYKEISITGVLPSQAQLIYHLDLYLTLGGPLKNGKQLIFIAQYSGKEHILWENEDQSDDLERQDLIEALDMVGGWLNEQAKWFEEETSGFFEVERVPVIYSEDGTGFISFNNCLVEIYEDAERTHKNVYLPAYESLTDFSFSPGGKAESYQEYVGKIFGKYGFQPFWVKGPFDKMIDDGGSLHCVVKVLQRSQAEQPPI